MNIRMWGLVVAVFVTAALGGCATAYQKNGLTGGFTERRISDTAYYVTFAGNGHTSRERVHWFWMYRCAELTLEKSHNLFVVDTTQRPSANGVPAGGPLRAAYTVAGGGRFVHMRGGAIPIIVPGAAATHWTSAATILMYDRPLPQETAEAWDAEVVRDTLAAYVKSDGKAPPPVANDLLKNALVIHDDVGLQSIEGIDTPKTDGNISDARLPRTEASVNEVLDGPFVRKVMRLGYRGSIGPGSPQRVPSTATWSITISPNGPVTRCDPVSDTLGSPKLVEDLTKFLQHLNFGPQDASETQVNRVTFYFKPMD